MFRRRDARGNLELSRFPLQTNNCFPQFAADGPPGVIQRSRSRGIGRRNGEINKAAAESGVPGFYFTIFILLSVIFLFF